MLLPNRSGGYVAVGPRDEVYVASTPDGKHAVWLADGGRREHPERLSMLFDTRKEAEAAMHVLVARAGSPSPVTFRESDDRIFVVLVGARFTQGSIDRLKEAFEHLGGKKIVILEVEPSPDPLR